MYLFIPLIEVVFCLGLLVVLATNGKRHVARRPFILLLAFMAAWGFFTFLMQAAPDMAQAYVCEELVLGSIVSVSLFFYRFTIALTGAKPHRYFLYPVYIGYFAILGLIPTGLVVSGVQMMWYGKVPVIGPLFPLYILAAYVPIVRSLMILLKRQKITGFVDDWVRHQYLILGTGAMFIGTIIDYLPALGINVYPLGIFGNILFCVTATTAMLRYNLLEMKVFIRKGVSYLLTGLLITGIFGSIIYLLSYIFRDFFSPISLTITIVAAFLAALIFRPMLTTLQHTVDRWFFHDRYGAIQVLQNFNRTERDLDLEQLTTSLLEAVTDGLQSRAVYLLLPSPATGDFEGYQYIGQKSQGQWRFAAGGPLLAAMQQNMIIDRNEIDIIPSLFSLSPDERQLLESNGIDLIVPLHNGRLEGILLLGHKINGGTYSIEDRRLLQIVSRHVAESIQNAGRYESLKHKHSDLKKAMDGIIYAMSLIVETRDPYTAGHQRRVAGLARAIANEMGLSGWQALGVYIAGLLHDVGKVAVPTEILSKPGKITPDEFRIIKKHSRIGYDILQKIEFPWPVTTAILQHHERLNGSGYPAGLSGDEIIIEARILGVADVVEAMSSHRPYRPALGLDTALDEISAGKGVLYDIEVADACLNLLRENEPEFDRIMAAAASNEGALEAVLK